MPDAALDAAARALARRLLRDLPADRPRTRADVDRLPAPVARLLHARLDAQAAEATALPHSPWVDPEADGVRAATRTWRDAVREAVRVPADVWAPAVEQAARLAVAHLVRPAETLAAYAFEGESGPLPASRVLRRLRAFGPYGYLSEIAGRYVERKEIDVLDRPALERLLQRIDRRMVSAFGPSEWAELLAPLADLVGPDGEPRGAVPADLLRALFQAKDVHPRRALLDADAASEDALLAWLADAFATETPSEPGALAPDVSGASGSAAEHAPAPGAAPAPLAETTPAETDSAVDTGDADLLAHFGVTADDAGAPDAEPPGPERTPETAGEPLAPEAEAPPAPPVIGSRYNDPAEAPVYDSDVLGPPRAVEAAPPASEPAGDVAVIFPHVPPEGPGEAPTPVPPSSTEAAAPGDEPLWQRLARQHGNETLTPASEATTPEAGEAPLWTRFAPVDEAPGTAPAPPAAPASLGTLEARVLGDADDDRRAWFVADLFGSSEDAYRETLTALDACRSYTEATRVIERDVFRAHRVNPYTDAAVAFVDALQAQFTAQGRG